jgi:potassium-transporting ATPase KdpC subunit
MTPTTKQPSLISQLLTHIRVSILATIVLGIIVSGIYPLIVFGLAQVLFHHQANGSLIGKDGQPVSNDADAIGSSLIGQNFSAPHYFHPRPSAAGNGYDPTASGGSNFGPTSDKLINGATQKDDKGNETLAYDGIRLRTFHYATDNGIAFKSNLPLDQFKDKQGNWDDVKLVDAFHADPPLVFSDFSTAIPGDAVTASGSGLDPHISLANAILQAQRVADARKLPLDKVKSLIDQSTDYPSLGFFGDAGVNVLKLNIALDNLK